MVHREPNLGRHLEEKIRTWEEKQHNRMAIFLCRTDATHLSEENMKKGFSWSLPIKFFLPLPIIKESSKATKSMFGLAFDVDYAITAFTSNFHVLFYKIGNILNDDDDIVAFFDKKMKELTDAVDEVVQIGITQLMPKEERSI